MRDRKEREPALSRLADLVELKEGHPRNNGVVSERGEQRHIPFEQAEPSCFSALENLRRKIDELTIATPRSGRHRYKAAGSQQFTALVEDRGESVEQIPKGSVRQILRVSRVPVVPLRDAPTRSRVRLTVH
jgi:hypothetical protein